MKALINNIEFSKNKTVFFIIDFCGYGNHKIYNIKITDGFTAEEALKNFAIVIQSGLKLLMKLVVKYHTRQFASSEFI